tara:strand:- start:189 stop:1283 length:1095 start_codon:yes stop_codon:yes gene_type:complete
MAVSRINEAGLNVNQYGNRNLLINGSHIVSQRGTSTTLATNTLNFCTDRWHLYFANFDEFAGTLTQDSDSPDGFSNSVKITTTTGESAIASNEYAHLTQLVEAQNLQQLAYGTSAAKQVTLSFHVKSSITGTFACGIYKQDNTAQIHNLTYTIDAANTWEKKTLTFAANTLSGGALDNNNGIGFYVNWHLAAGASFKGGGSTSGWSAYSSAKWADGLGTDAVMTTTNATFFLTGCQLEVGDTATDFEHRTFDDELEKCRRYFFKYSTNGDAMGAGIWYANNQVLGYHKYPKRMRAAPTMSNSGAGCMSCYTNGSSILQAGGSVHDNIQLDSCRWNFTTASNGTAGDGTMMQLPNGTFIQADAEL